MSDSTTLLPFQPVTISTAQLVAVSFLARHSGRTHALYTYQLKRWVGRCEGNGLDPLSGMQRAHVGLSIHHVGDTGQVDSWIVTMHGVRGDLWFAYSDGLITADPAVYARLPKVQRDETRTQGLDRLELIRFLHVAQTRTVHRRALAMNMAGRLLVAFRYVSRSAGLVLRLTLVQSATSQSRRTDRIPRVWAPTRGLPGGTLHTFHASPAGSTAYSLPRGKVVRGGARGGMSGQHVDGCESDGFLSRVVS